uniref:Uncharacterized protein n=1 Tax=Anguilla anguilla TaxID=7936 RepID=A0A0E9RX53_ANGAN
MQRKITPQSKRYLIWCTAIIHSWTDLTCSFP